MCTSPWSPLEPPFILTGYYYHSQSEVCVNGSGGARVEHIYGYLVANITGLLPGITHTGTASTDMM